MAFIGPYQQYTIDGTNTVARVQDWVTQATAINTGLAQAVDNANAYTDAEAVELTQSVAATYVPISRGLLASGTDLHRGRSWACFLDLHEFQQDDFHRELRQPGYRHERDKGSREPYNRLGGSPRAPPTGPGSTPTRSPTLTSPGWSRHSLTISKPTERSEHDHYGTITAGTRHHGLPVPCPRPVDRAGNVLTRAQNCCCKRPEPRPLRLSGFLLRNRCGL